MLLKAVFNNPLGAAREMDRLFDSMVSSQPFGSVPTIRSQWTYPAVNLWEDGERFLAEAELPGMTMDDIEVLVTEDELSIKGSRTVDASGEQRTLRRERPVGAFERRIALPSAIDTEHVEAKLTNGVLSITLPKAAECKPRRVEVKTLPDAS